jgi:hypothetical protein
VTVRVAQGRVDLTATAAPLADVLERLARQTGMKVVYEGPAPRQLVTVSLHGRTPAETVLAVFEGLGLNYALVADPSGASVQTLMVAGASTTGTASSASSPAAGSPAVRPNVRRSFGPPPGSSPEATEPAFDEGDEQADPSELDFTGLPPGADPSEAGGPAPTVPAPGNVPVQGTAPPPGAGVVPTQPSSPFSASPFTPQPQPFLPAPPGAATGTNPPQSEEGKPQAPPPQ